MKKTLTIILLAAFFATGSAADCDRAAELYNQAVSSENFAQRKRILKQAAGQCDNFNIHYELGKACFELGEFDQADQSFRDALNTAADDRATAKVQMCLGMVYEKQGRDDDALYFYRASHTRQPSPSALEKMKSIDFRRMQTGMRSDEIKKSLAASRRITRSFGKKGWGVRPSLDLYVNFEFRKWDLNPSGKAQAEELGRALSDKAYQNDRFVLIGHTDSIGPDDYNLTLSRNRARTVREFVIKNFFIGPDRIDTEGRGESELKYPEETDRDRALNRRVEVTYNGLPDR